MPIRSKQNKLELKQGKIQSPAGVHANKKVWDSRISPETFRRLDEGITLVAVSGYTKQDYVKYLMDKYGLSVRSANSYYSEVLKALRPENMEEYREDMIQKNFARLEALYKKAVDSNNLKIANEIMRTINTMLGVGGNKVRIGQEQTDGTKNVIEISFE